MNAGRESASKIEATHSGWSNILSHSHSATASNHNFTVIYLLSWAGLIKQPPHWCSDDAFPGLNLLEAANWLSNCRKIMSWFPLVDLFDWQASWAEPGIAEGPVHSRTTGDLTLKLSKLGKLPLGDPDTVSHMNLQTHPTWLKAFAVVENVIAEFYYLLQFTDMVVVFFNSAKVGSYYPLLPLYPVKAQWFFRDKLLYGCFLDCYHEVHNNLSPPNS